MSDKVPFSTIVPEELLHKFKLRVDNEYRTYSGVISKLMEIYINETLDNDIFTRHTSTEQSGDEKI